MSILTIVEDTPISLDGGDYVLEGGDTIIILEADDSEAEEIVDLDDLLSSFELEKAKKEKDVAKEKQRPRKRHESEFVEKMEAIFGPDPKQWPLDIYQRYAISQELESANIGSSKEKFLQNVKKSERLAKKQRRSEDSGEHYGKLEYDFPPTEDFPSVEVDVANPKFTKKSKPSEVFDNIKKTMVRWQSEAGKKHREKIEKMEARYGKNWNTWPANIKNQVVVMFNEVVAELPSVQDYYELVKNDNIDFNILKQTIDQWSTPNNPQFDKELGRLKNNIKAAELRYGRDWNRWDPKQKEVIVSWFDEIMKIPQAKHRYDELFRRKYEPIDMDAFKATYDKWEDVAGKFGSEMQDLVVKFEEQYDKDWDKWPADIKELWRNRFWIIDDRSGGELKNVYDDIITKMIDQREVEEGFVVTEPSYIVIDGRPQRVNVGNRIIIDGIISRI